MPRPGLERVTRSIYHPVYNPDGTPRIIAYIPFHALKKNQGDTSSSSEKASMVFSRNACLPCPQCPKLCPFRVWEEMVYHLDQVPHKGDRKYKYFEYLPS